MSAVCYVFDRKVKYDVCGQVVKIKFETILRVRYNRSLDSSDLFVVMTELYVHSAVKMSFAVPQVNPNTKIILAYTFLFSTQ